VTNALWNRNVLSLFLNTSVLEQCYYEPMPVVARKG